MGARGHTLPPGAITYGRPNYKTDSGTAGALKYSPLNERIKSAAPIETDKDLIKLNRIGIRQGIITASDQKNFRAQHDDIRLAPPAREVRSRHCPPPDIVFGKASRPRSPIYDVIEHKFQLNWLVLRRNNATKQEVEPGTLWQMGRFQKQQPTIESFRTSLDRERSFAAYHQNKAAKLGTNRRGITVMASM